MAPMAGSGVYFSPSSSLCRPATCYQRSLSIPYREVMLCFLCFLCVYSGTCLRTPAADGRPHQEAQGVNAGRRKFEQQMELVGRIHHDNVVDLRAYYYSKDEKLLVYVSTGYSKGSVSNMIHAWFEQMTAEVGVGLKVHKPNFRQLGYQRFRDGGGSGRKLAVALGHLAA